MCETRVSNGYSDNRYNIGCASAVRINLPEVGGAIDQYNRPFALSSKFDIPPLLGSGAMVSANISKIGQLYVLSDSVPCLFSKAIVGKISAALGSSKLTQIFSAKSHDISRAHLLANPLRNL